MCAKDSPSAGRRSKRATKAVIFPTKPARRSKPRNRKKPKFLSLKLELSTKKNLDEGNKGDQTPPPSPPLIRLMTCHKKKQKQPVKLFPLHSESLVLDDDRKVVDMQDDQHHVALLFETATDDTSTTLDGLLDSSTTTSDERDPLSPSLSCVYSYKLSDLQTNLSRQAPRSVDNCGGGGGGASSSLLRAAIRCKEREASQEERWVSYNEVVEGGKSVKREADQEVSSCCGVEDDSWVKVENVQQLVGLKLDKYQDILDAWSDKDPFCLKGDGDDHSLPQIVPDSHGGYGVLMDGWGSSGNVWMVPRVGQMKLKEKEKEKEGWKWEQREASVLRYREKRQSRLFSKRIRYQVRKLNAEKRPRLKGRFVKRNGEGEVL